VFRLIGAKREKTHDYFIDRRSHPLCFVPVGTLLEVCFALASLPGPFCGAGLDHYLAVKICIQCFLAISWAHAAGITLKKDGEH
jgi:hypothetical protein